MLLRTDFDRMNKIMRMLQSEKTLTELNIRDRLGIGISTYQQLKREAKLRYPIKISIDSKRGEVDRWSLYEVENIE